MTRTEEYSSPLATAFSINPARLRACIFLGSFSSSRSNRISISEHRNDELKRVETNLYISWPSRIFPICNVRPRESTDTLYVSVGPFGRSLECELRNHRQRRLFSCLVDSARERLRLLTHEDSHALCYLDLVV